MAEWVLGTSKSAPPYGYVPTYQLEKNNEPDQYETFISDCVGLNEATAKRTRGKSAEWIDGTYGNTLLHFAITPNGHSCKNDHSFAFGAMTAASYHGNKVNVLFLDGHVSSIASTISQVEWRALSTRAGGEVTQDYY